METANLNQLNIEVMNLKKEMAKMKESIKEDLEFAIRKRKDAEAQADSAR